ncbi:MAG: hypothetical protein ACPGU5_07560 [Lishizhenia sp.]
MNKWIIALSTLALFSCKTDNTSSENTTEISKEELIKLQNEVNQLRLESQNKDSLVNESMAFFNEIQDNLAKISLKKDEIRIKSESPELNVDGRDWIRQQIHGINVLREQNAKLIRNLQGKLKQKDIKIAELQGMIDRLVLQIKSKDEQIESLQNQLADLDMEYSELFDEYQEQVDLALDVMHELNKIYYTMGTQEELIANGVIEQEGGFIGIGKKTDLSDEMNQNYFTKGDRTKTKSITVIGEKPRIITDHSSSAYKWEGNKLVITDYEKFWKISKYLVIITK